MSEKKTGNVTTMLLKLLSRKELPNIFLKTYQLKPTFWNYLLICGLGVIINQVVIHLFIQSLPLWIANFLAIFLAFIWNYMNALGPLAKYWGMKE